MKHKIFTLFLALVASAGTMFAEFDRGYQVEVDGFYYYLDNENYTAMFTYQEPEDCAGYCFIQYEFENITIPSSIVPPHAQGEPDQKYTVTHIGAHALYSSYLKTLSIPNSIVSISNEAFTFYSSGPGGNYDYNLTYIIVASDNPNYCAEGGVLYDKQKKELLVYPAQKDATIFTVPNSVEQIDRYAFAGNNHLVSVTLPVSIGMIDYYTFNGCEKLETVQLNDGINYIAGSAFANCSSLKSINLPEGLNFIDGDAFQNCSSLTTLIFPSTLTGFCVSFYGCTNLEYIKIPSTVTSYGEYLAIEREKEIAKQGWSNISDDDLKDRATLAGFLRYDSWNENYTLDYPANLAKLKKVEAPAWFFDVPEEYWYLCTKYLEYVVVNNSELNDNVLSVIGRSYKNLTSLDLAGATNTTLPDEALKGFYNLTAVALPNGLTEISYMAVAECKNLQSIAIPASVTTIHQSAFENCRSLKTITFGETAAAAPARFNAPAASNSQLRSIGNWAFYNCHQLQNLEIPEGVTEIGDGAFYGCTYLEKLTLPASVREIGDNTFALCSKMKRIVVNAANPPSIQEKTFYDVQREIPVYVPDESVDTYKNNASWKEFNIQGRSSMHEAIDQIRDNLPVTNKVLVGNQILILRGEKSYTLQGQEVK